MSDNTPSGGLGLLEETELDSLTDTPWQTILSNDPVNLIPVVVGICQKVLKCSHEEATRYTLLVHTEGKAAVYSGSKEKAEEYAAKFRAAMLWSHAERTGS